MTAACCLLSVAQRRLSTPARRAAAPDGGGLGEQRMSRRRRVVELTEARLSAPLEGALSVLWMALVLLAAGLVAVRL